MRSFRHGELHVQTKRVKMHSIPQHTENRTNPPRQPFFAKAEHACWISFCSRSVSCVHRRERSVNDEHQAEEGVNS